MKLDERKAFGQGWDAQCNGETPASGCLYTAGSRLAAWYVQGYDEATLGFGDEPVEAGDWKRVAP